MVIKQWREFQKTNNINIIDYIYYMVAFYENNMKDNVNINQLFYIILLQFNIIILFFNTV